MAGQRPGMVQRAQSDSDQRKFRTKNQDDGLVYSFVTGEGPGEGTINQLGRDIQEVDQRTFLQEIKGNKFAEAKFEEGPKREVVVVETKVETADGAEKVTGEVTADDKVILQERNGVKEEVKSPGANSAKKSGSQKSPGHAAPVAVLNMDQNSPRINQSELMQVQDQEAPDTNNLKHKEDLVSPSRRQGHNRAMSQKMEPSTPKKGTNQSEIESDLQKPVIERSLNESFKPGMENDEMVLEQTSIKEYSVNSISEMVGEREGANRFVKTDKNGMFVVEDEIEEETEEDEDSDEVEQQPIQSIPLKLTEKKAENNAEVAAFLSENKSPISGSNHGKSIKSVKFEEEIAKDVEDLENQDHDKNITQDVVIQFKKTNSTEKINEKVNQTQNNSIQQAGTKQEKVASTELNVQTSPLEKSSSQKGTLITVGGQVPEDKISPNKQGSMTVEGQVQQDQTSPQKRALMTAEGQVLNEKVSPNKQASTNSQGQVPESKMSPQKRISMNLNEQVSDQKASPYKQPLMTSQELAPEGKTSPLQRTSIAADGQAVEDKTSLNKQTSMTSQGQVPEGKISTQKRTSMTVNGQEVEDKTSSKKHISMGAEEQAPVGKTSSKKRTITAAERQLNPQPPLENETNNIFRGGMDTREFNYIQLPNGMRCLLICDPAATQSAASLQVKAGSFMDPQGFQGTAQYLQNMITKGSKKYPQIEHNEGFFTRRGGELNSYANWTTTNYHFEIQNQFFDKGLDRFANMFISPTFPAAQNQPVIKKIHHQMKSAHLSDFWHHTNLYLQLANSRSRISQYTFGNKTQLSKLESKKAMFDFYNQYYSANLMTLCVSSNMKMPELKKLVTQTFKGIKNTEAEIPDFKNPRPFGKDNSKKLIKMVPVDDINELKIVWNLPYLANQINKIHLKYFMELFGHEGDNSILSYLKSQDLATFLQVSKHSIGFCLTKFEISIDLTQKGLKNIPHVVAAVFKYAQMLSKKGPLIRFCNELNQMGKLKYFCPDNKKPMDMCIKFAKKLQIIENDDDVKNIVRHSYIKDDLDLKLLTSLGQIFGKSERCNIFVRSKQLEGECVCEEGFMKTKFLITPMPQNILDAIADPDHILNLTDQKLTFPKTNKLLPFDFSIKNFDDSYNKPKLVPTDLEHTDLWFQQDSLLKSPKSIIQCKLFTNDLNFGSNARTQAFVHLWIRMLLLTQHQYLYQASKAGLTMDIQINTDSITFKWQGYNDTIYTFVRETISKMIKMKKEGDGQNKLKIYSAACEQLRSEWQRHECEKQYKQAINIFDKIMEKNAVIEADLLKELEKYDFDKFVSDLKQWMISGTTTWFIHGNMLEAEATQLVTEVITKKLKLTPTPISVIAKSETLKVEQGKATLYQQEIDDSSCLYDTYLTYYQLDAGQQGSPEELKRALCNSLVYMYLEEPFKDSLKNGEKFNKVGVKETYQNRQLGICLVSTSDSRSSEYQCQKINEFLLKSRQNLQYLNDLQFADMKAVLAEMLKQKSKSIEQENERMWKEIATSEFVFDRASQSLKILGKISKRDFTSHLNLLFFDQTTSRLDVSLVSKQNETERKTLFDKNNQSAFFKNRLPRSADLESAPSIEKFKSKQSFNADMVKEGILKIREQK